ncbi:MAG: hydroxyacylglutathione hydrolase [SAR324 cluster bacterium]|nr:hydroxyacylglutathione hydrolase [SAR324 cluster bacterium]
MKVIPISCLHDNYSYLIICPTTGQTAVVDPSEAVPVLEQLKSLNLTLHVILNTHHHWDHVDGNPRLTKEFPGIPVYAHVSDKERLPQQTVFLEEGDTVQIGELKARVIHNPGHTTGAISYYFEHGVFTGDTLFGGGCGRLFEGSPETMYHSLNEKLGKLPESTPVFCGHEYTENNLRFAASIEPGNTTLQQRLQQVHQLRAKGQMTVPSTLGEEKATNPFLRCDSQEIQQYVRKKTPACDLTPVEVFRVIRELKNHW